MFSKNILKIFMWFLKFQIKLSLEKKQSSSKIRMNINDKSVLDLLNNLIVINRLNKVQILQMVNLVYISNDINDLKDNLKWESSISYL
tara:strand:+ start:103 stop:366 length:264 start_codon:yes stop_codon:yes gene_type:complete